MAVHPPIRAGLLFVILVVVWSLSVTFAQEDLRPLPIPFTATLDSDGLASPVVSGGSGEVRALLIGNELMVAGTYRDLSSPLNASRFATGANIRRVAADEDGGVVRRIAEQATLETSRNMTLDTDGGTSGWFTGVFTLTDEQVEELKRGLYYVQLYTQQNRTGELRGRLGTDVVLDVTVEDLAGVWRTVDGDDMWQGTEDGTWSYLNSLAEVGEASTWRWWLEGDIATWDIPDGECRGRYVHREVLYRDGRRRALTLEAGPCSSVGSWLDMVKIDTEGNRVDLR